MHRFHRLIVLLFAGLSLCGCASSRWSAGRPTLGLLSPTPPVRQTASGSSSATSDRPEPEKMQEVMAELRQLGAIDPVAQDRLLEDLRQSDPSIWPLVVRQFRATAAYRQRAMERAEAEGQPAERLPPVCNVAAAPQETPQDASAHTPAPPIETTPSADCAPNQVVPASYTAPAAADWRQQLAGAIKTLEAEVAENPAAPAKSLEHARLRMLYAAAGRSADAVQPIPTAPPAAQSFLASEMEGLTAWLDVEQTPDAALRDAKAKASLAAAVGKLAESAPLLVRNVAFCTEVQSYGCAKRFEKYEFQPNQEVLLYAEVENFASQPTQKGYHTSLKSSYRIIDERGRCVAEHAFAPTEEHCQNLRRDFFIGYHLRLPKHIGPGKYTLQLSIEDLQCRKVGQTSIEFEVK